MADSEVMIAEDDALEVKDGDDVGEEVDLTDSAVDANLQEEHTTENDAKDDPEDETGNDLADDAENGPENDDVLLETVDDISLELGDAAGENEEEAQESGDIAEAEDSFVDAEAQGTDDVKEDENAKEAEDAEEDEEDEEEEEEMGSVALDPNVMPQVNVTVLAKRKWQVKVYPLKPADFTSGHIARVFKNARESLLYLISAGKYARGKGEMYISSVNQSLRVVKNLMTLDCHFPEINIEVIKKNDEGVIEEKAYMRFDTKMVRMLFVPMSSVFRMAHSHMHGRKRERLIGSVFVKNLPAGTTKDMLRVMFPFAQEINYNPEKFKEGTARLVLKTRSTVIPCLKAFAKVELGGNVLELHPLEKKKRRTEDDEAKPVSRHRSKSAREGSGKEDEENEKSGSKQSEESKKEGSKSKESASSKGGDKKEESETSSAKKETPKKGKEADTGARKPIGKTAEDIKKRARSTWLQNKRAGLVAGQDKRKLNTGSGARPNTGKSQTGDTRPLRGGYRSTFRKDKNAPEHWRERSSYNRNRFDSGRTMGNRTSGAGSNRNRSFGGAPSRNLGSAGRTGRGSRSFGERRMSSGFSLNSDLGVNAEATKDMMVLQNQLSMAIKSQLAMLNQTQMAVEHVKRGATGLGLGSSLGAGSSSAVLAGGSFGGLSVPVAEHSVRDDGDNEAFSRQYAGRSRSRDRPDSLNQSGGMGYSHKRNVDQAGLRSPYSQGGYSNKRSNPGAGGQHRRGPKRGGGSGYYQQQNADAFYPPTAYDMEDELEGGDYSGYSGRSFNAFTSGGRKNSGNIGSGYRY